MAAPHALVIPYPAQGHVIPFMELAHAMEGRGFTVTFVNTDFNHARVVAAMSSDGGAGDGQLGRVRLVSVPDGLAPGEDRNELARLTVAMAERMAPCVEALVKRSGEEDGKITCVVADYNVGAWALGIARRAGLRSAAVLATILGIPKLVQDNVIDANGCALSQETFQLCPGMPPMQTAHLAWNCIGDIDMPQELLFRQIVLGVHAVEDANFVLCNSFVGAEPLVFAHHPKILPVGPLLTGSRRGKAVGHFWLPDDATCIPWLDTQPPRSVIHVAFGSFTVFDERQFQELALGLEMSKKPFLWVVRPDIGNANGPATAHAFPDWFLRRVEGRGKVVEWSPQQRVLAHPAVACFVTHCGWNSTMEAVRNGVPLLAWPYFADQFVNEMYICDVWKVGLRAVADSTAGVVMSGHLAAKVEQLIGDGGVRERAEALKKVAHESVLEGGSSHENFNKFLEAMKEG